MDWGQNQVLGQRESVRGELVNSLARPVSPSGPRRWSPETSQKERNRRKREREDLYVRNFAPENRPVLLVKKKEAFAGDDQFFKSAKPATIVADVDEELIRHAVEARRETFLRGPTNDQKVYKIEGIEFLPEGFLELEPLLFADEFAFDAKVFRRMFDEEQRRTRELRRKQYAQKNYQKQREVTIVSGGLRTKILDFFERFYAKHKRRMNRLELETVAKQLGSTPEDFSNLQNVFLDRKRLLNLSTLSDFFERKAGNSKFAHVAPKVYSDSQSFHPTFLSQYSVKIKKSRSQKIFDRLGTDQSRNKSAQPDRPKTPRTQLSSGNLFADICEKFERTLGESTNRPSEVSETVPYVYSDRSADILKVTGASFTVEPEELDEISRFFDREIGIILEKIQGVPDAEIEETRLKSSQGQLFTDEKHRLMNCKNVLDPPKDAASFVEFHKARLLAPNFNPPPKEAPKAPIPVEIAPKNQNSNWENIGEDPDDSDAETPEDILLSSLAAEVLKRECEKAGIEYTTVIARQFVDYCADKNVPLSEIEDEVLAVSMFFSFMEHSGIEI